MRIYFVRHGHPDYKNDCLTALGHRQAEEVAERLKTCGIERIFSSTKGRALMTAEYTAKALSLEVAPCDFMREISWGPVGDDPILANGHPWDISDIYASEGKSLRMPDWRTEEPYSQSKIVKCFDTVTRGLDAWLEELGYKREGEYYRVVGKETDKAVAMFGHGGSFCAAFSHLFGIPIPQVCGFFRVDFTGVVLLEFSNEKGELIYPKMLSSDAYHIKGLEGESYYGN